MNWLNAAVLLAMPLIGGFIALSLKKKSENFHKFILSLTGAYLFGITILHLMPEVYGIGGFSIGVWILAGFFIQLLLEQLTKGVEHGHFHVHEQKSPSMFFISIMIGLSLHALLEGMPLAEGAHDHHHHHHHHGHDHDGNQFSLLSAIAMHKLPAGFALMAILIASNVSKVKSIVLLIIFAIMTPLGMLVGNFVVNSTQHITVTGLPIADIIMCIVIGSFFHISTTILFESSGKMHTFQLSKIIAILVGIGMAVLTLI